MLCDWIIPCKGSGYNTLSHCLLSAFLFLSTHPFSLSLSLPAFILFAISPSLHSWRWLHWSRWAAWNLSFRPPGAAACVFDGARGGLHSEEQTSQPVLQGHARHPDLLQVQQRVGSPEGAHCGGAGWWKLWSVNRSAHIYKFTINTQTHSSVHLNQLMHFICFP